MKSPVSCSLNSHEPRCTAAWLTGTHNINVTWSVNGDDGWRVRSTAHAPTCSHLNTHTSLNTRLIQETYLLKTERASSTLVSYDHIRASSINPNENKTRIIPTRVHSSVVLYCIFRLYVWAFFFSCRLTRDFNSQISNILIHLPSALATCKPWQQLQHWEVSVKISQFGIGIYWRQFSQMSSTTRAFPTEECSAVCSGPLERSTLYVPVGALQVWLPWSTQTGIAMAVYAIMATDTTDLPLFLRPTTT